MQRKQGLVPIREVFGGLGRSETMAPVDNRLSEVLLAP